MFLNTETDEENDIVIGIKGNINSSYHLHIINTKKDLFAQESVVIISLK